MDIAKQAGISKGNLFYSSTFKSWAVKSSDEKDGHANYHLSLVNAPYKEGDIIPGNPDNPIKAVKIEGNEWVFYG